MLTVLLQLHLLEMRLYSNSGYATLETKFNNDGTKMFVLDSSGVQ